MDFARDPHAAVDALLRRFRSQRPLRGGSLLITIFGDAIAPRGGRVMLGSLIGLARPFGLSERLVRTSVARLAAEGWLTATRHGRRSEYRLTDNGERLFAEATRRIYGASPRAWDGRWTLVILPPAGGPPRRTLREELRWLGFGALAPGVFAHPSCSLEEARSWLEARECAGESWLFKSAAEGLEHDRRLAAAGWDLAGIARRYHRFRDVFAPVQSAAGLAPLSPQAAFLVRTLLIHEYRKIHLRDPQLPPDLLPRAWIGAEAYELCRSLYAAVFAGAEEYLTQTAQAAQQMLPPPGPAVYARFGGLTDC
jgi:phenylacetic acid degradation operon negative regulatory protein